MSQTSILLPMIALAAWTFMVLGLIPYRRFRAYFARQVTVADFRYGESASVPPDVGIPNRNYMNLLELPVLFYAACLSFFVTGSAGPLAVSLAWAYVALRAAHSLVHLTYNRVEHRMAVFALSNFVLMALWVVLGIAIGRAP